MSMHLSKIVSDLFAKLWKGKASPSPSPPPGLEEELRKAVLAEDTIYGRFHTLLESFRGIIPDEQQRILAALKAMAATEKLSRDEIVKAFDDQLGNLSAAGKNLTPVQSALRAELEAMDARALAVKDEIAKLRGTMAQLEKELQALLGGKAGREENLRLAETAVKDLFGGIAADMMAVRNTLETLSAQPPAAPPAPPPPAPVPPTATPPKAEAPAAAPREAKKAESETPPAFEETHLQKKCPMCGGAFNLLELEKIWQCYTCGYEEPAAGAEQQKSVVKPEPKTAPAGAQPSATRTETRPEPTEESPDIEEEPAVKSKPCPVCMKTMRYNSDDRMWRCPSCQYQGRN